jgi:hypothetical protein
VNGTNSTISTLAEVTRGDVAENLEWQPRRDGFMPVKDMAYSG